MNDAMNVQKVFTPISSTQRVRRLKKENPDSQRRGFERDLEEEKEGEKNALQNATLEMVKTSDETADPDADLKKRNNHGETVGTRVDIQA